MKEKSPKQRDLAVAGFGTGSIFDEFEEASPTATVVAHPYDERLPIVGLTVGHVRARHRDRLGIAPESVATLDGAEVSDDTVIEANQTLEFKKAAGLKGVFIHLP